MVSTIAFKHPIKILQVFRNITEYGKDKKSYSDRKTDDSAQIFSSKSGFVREGELFLPESIVHHSNFPNCGLITLEDSQEVLSAGPTNYCFQLHHPNVLHIFQLLKEEELELFLNYDHFEVGIPRRSNFKIGELRHNLPLEIKINGKIDFSLSSGRPRIFKEQWFVFIYLGEFSQCRLLKEPYPPFQKKVPKERKQVNLLKPLW